MNATSIHQLSDIEAIIFRETFMGYLSTLTTTEATKCLFTFIELHPHDAKEQFDLLGQYALSLPYTHLCLFKALGSLITYVDYQDKICHQFPWLKPNQP